MFDTGSQDYAWWDIFLTSFINFKILFSSILLCHFCSPSTSFIALKTMQSTLLTGVIGGLLCACPNHMDSTVQVIICFQYDNYNISFFLLAIQILCRIIESCIKKRIQWNNCFARKVCKESEYYEEMMRYLRKNLAVCLALNAT